MLEKHNMQVCIKGHKITGMYDEYPKERKNKCPQCGSDTINKCPKCGDLIEGDSNVYGCNFEKDVYDYCSDCGEAFPWVESKKLESLKNKEQNPELILIQIFSKFHTVARNLRREYHGRNTIDIKDEYDVQYVLNSIFPIFFDDIRPEEWTPSYAGVCSRVDFLLKEEGIMIEVKKTRDTLKDKQIGEQLIVDTERYKIHPNCKKLFCFVYDPDGYIANPKGLENDLLKKEKDFEVKVFIFPKDQTF